MQSLQIKLMSSVLCAGMILPLGGIPGATAQENKDAPRVYVEIKDEKGLGERMDLILEELSYMRMEINALREEVLYLNQQLEAEMPLENDPLYPAEEDMNAPPQPPVEDPLPAEEPRFESTTEDTAEAVETEAPEFWFKILNEWGRSPDAARKLGESVTSIKGMVLLVGKEAARADIEQLGRDLRRQFDAYDNISIDIFDDMDAAQGFIQKEVANPVHRVLTISRQRASNRDVVLYTRDGANTPIQ